jgi:hypothetical protein
MHVGKAGMHREGREGGGGEGRREKGEGRGRREEGGRKERLM